MKLANSNGTNGSTWHIYKHKEKDEQSICGKKTIKRVGTRRWIRLEPETPSQAENKIQHKIGQLCKNCKQEITEK